jgi:hypothetical protein
VLSRDAFSLITYAKLSSNFAYIRVGYLQKASAVSRSMHTYMIVFAGFIAISYAIYKQILAFLL